MMVCCACQYLVVYRLLCLCSTYIGKCEYELIQQNLTITALSTAIKTNNWTLKYSPPRCTYNSGPKITVRKYHNYTSVSMFFSFWPKAKALLKFTCVSTDILPQTHSCALRPGLGHKRAHGSIRRKLFYGGMANGWSSTKCKNEQLVRSETYLVSCLQYRSLAKASIQSLTERLSSYLSFSRSITVTKTAAVSSD